MAHEVLEVVVGHAGVAEGGADGGQQLQELFEHHAVLLALAVVERDQVLPVVAVLVERASRRLVGVRDQLHEALLRHLAVGVAAGLRGVVHEQITQFLQHLLLVLLQLVVALALHGRDQRAFAQSAAFHRDKIYWQAYNS